jgi:hypothetical protein
MGTENAEELVEEAGWGRPGGVERFEEERRSEEWIFTWRAARASR